jgi:chromodomain-helicase-DNA-binding protein 7
LQKQYYRALYEKNVGFLHKGDKHRADTSQVMNLHMELRKCCNHPFLLGRTVEDDVSRHFETTQTMEPPYSS